MNIVITAGGTSEPIDKVRKITNMSGGTLGRAIAKSAAENPNVDTIFFLSVKEAFPPFNRGGKIVPVETGSTQEVSDALEKVLRENEIGAVIHSMAISDYTVDFLFDFEKAVEYVTDTTDAYSSEEVLNLLLAGAVKIDNSSKVSSDTEHLAIKLKKTPKIISKIKSWAPNATLVGFKLLEDVSDEELIRVAKAQMEKNGCDYVWANDIRRIRGLDGHEGGHQGILVTRDNAIKLKGAEKIAEAIVKAATGEAYV